MSISMPAHLNNHIAAQVSRTGPTNHQSRHSIAVDNGQTPVGGHLNMRRQPHDSTTNAKPHNTALTDPYRMSNNLSSVSIPANISTNQRNLQSSFYTAQGLTNPTSFNRLTEPGKGTHKGDTSMARGAANPRPVSRHGPRPASVNIAGAHSQITPAEMSLSRLDHNKPKKRSQEPHAGANQPGALQRTRRSSMHARPCSYIDLPSHSRHVRQSSLQPTRMQGTLHLPRDFRINSWPPQTSNALGLAKSASVPTQVNKRALSSSHFLLKDQISHIRAAGNDGKPSSKNQHRPQRSVITVTVRPKDDCTSHKVDSAELDKRRTSLPVTLSAQTTFDPAPMLMPAPTAVSTTASSSTDDDLDKENLPSPINEPPQIASSPSTKRMSFQSFMARFGPVLGELTIQDPNPTSESTLGTATAQGLASEEQAVTPRPRGRLSRPMSAVFLSSTGSDQVSGKSNFLQLRVEDVRSKFRWRMPLRELPPDAEQETAGENEAGNQLNEDTNNARALSETPNNALIPSEPSSKTLVARRLGRSMHQRARSLVGTFKPRLARTKQTSIASLSSDSSLDSFSNAILETGKAGTPSPRKGGSTQSVAFSSDVLCYDTWPSEEYDRSSGMITSAQLTPLLVEQIKEELNEFKMEMKVHKSSKFNTHFYLD